MIYKIIRKKFIGGSEHRIYIDDDVLTYVSRSKIRTSILSDMSKNKKAFIKSEFSFSPKYKVYDDNDNYIKIKGKMNFKELMKEIKFESNCLKINGNENFIGITEDTFTVTDIKSGSIITTIKQDENEKSEIIYTVDIQSTKYLELILGLVIGIDKTKH